MAWAVLGAVHADTSPGVDGIRQKFARGDFGAAATILEGEIANRRAAGDSAGTARLLVDLAAACQELGQQRRAASLLEDAVKLAGSAGDPAIGRLCRHQLGAVLVLTRDLGRARDLLTGVLGKAREAGDPSEAAILNDLGNLERVAGHSDEALARFRESAGKAREQGDSRVLARALCNAATTAAAAQQTSEARDLNGEALAVIRTLPPSNARSFLLLTAARTDRLIAAGIGNGDRHLLLRANEALRDALASAESLGDRRSETHALGQLAEMYAADGQPDAALGVVRRAIAAAQQAGLPDALYRWEWQLGRLLAAQGDTAAAVAAYRRAADTLGPIRNDLALGHGNVPGPRSFRESQGPLYFEMADLLLRQADSAPDDQAAQRLLAEARAAVEEMKSVELEDYFRDDCVNVQRSNTRAIESVDPRTAVIYVIPLPGRTEILLGLSSGLKRVKVDVDAAMLAAEVRQFRRNLETRTTYRYLAQAQRLYDWIIRPLRPFLSGQPVDTLVFVPDGALRTVPLAALHDGDRFLVEEFAVAVVPGLSLVQPEPIRKERSRLLLSGLSEPVQGFPPLEYVPGELETIRELRTGEVLLDGDFSLRDFRRHLTDEQYSIIHIASHGQFDPDVRKTFVLTHDSRLTLNDLEALIRPAQYRGRPVEMLVLSACQTAAGDDRAALGLAGVAVKAGARSALATLWFVNDESTSILVSEVYRQLMAGGSVSKARALQQAQIRLLQDRRYRHPCYWSPYLVIGNWL